jgi:molecular chaperone GrpE
LNEPEAEKCRLELAKVKDAYIRLAADFDNYKKRVAKDEARFVFLAQSDFFLKLLPIVDDFERAFKQGVENKAPEVQAWLSGFEIISKELSSFLKENGVEEVQMKVFDPEIHEAISQVEVEGQEPGQIVDFVEKGYKLKGQLLRAGKVAVSK